MTALLLSLVIAPPPQWQKIADSIVPGRTVYALNAFVHQGRIALFSDVAAWSSADGASWSPLCPEERMPGSPSIGTVVECGGRVFVLGTRHGSRSAPDEVWTSRDGGSWSVLGSTLPAQGVYASDGSRVWVIAPMGGAWSSADGVHWRSESKGGWDEPLAALVHEGALQVFDTAGGTWVRSRGAWTRTATDGPWVGRWRPSFASFDGKVWMIGGTDKPDYAVFDGGSWRSFPLPAGWRPRASPRLVPFGGSLIVFGGKTGHETDSNPQSVWAVR